jgi:hypothetical protein
VTGIRARVFHATHFCVTPGEAHPVDALRLCGGVSHETAEASGSAYVFNTAVAAL